MARQTVLDPEHAQTKGLKALRGANATSTVEPTTMWQGILHDRQAKAESARAKRQEVLDAARAEKEAAALLFRKAQVAKAPSHEWYGELKAGVAKKVADAILANFAEIELTDGIRRTDAAIAAAIGTLSDDEVTRDRAVRHGINVARQALSWAFGQVKMGK